MKSERLVWLSKGTDEIGENLAAISAEIAKLSKDVEKYALEIKSLFNGTNHQIAGDFVSNKGGEI